MQSRPVLSNVPLVAPWVLATVLLGHALLKAVFFSGAWLSGVAIPVENATDGLVSMTTLAGLVTWVLLVGGAMGALGRLRPAELGLSARSLRESLPVLLGLWLTAQVVLGALGTAAGDLTWAPSARSWSAAAGLRLQAVLGSGLIEEVLYRGFLLVQAYAWLRRRRDATQALWMALAATSLYFGVNHVPAGLRMGLAAPDLALYVAQCALGGMLFAALFLRTGNLFVAAGAHALVNDPAALFATAVDPSLVVLVGASALLLAWPLLGRQFGSVFTLGVVEGRPAL